MKLISKLQPRQAARLQSPGFLRWLRRGVLALAVLCLLGTGWALFQRTLNQPITLLLLGSDNRREDGPSRSDAIFILRTDPERGLIRGLSLPRDLYVPIMGLPLFRKQDRINSALFWGDYYGADGLTAARETIHHLLGIPVDSVVLVRFNLVKEVVDTLGGVEVYFDKPVADKKFHSMDGQDAYPLRFESGWNFLDGRRALEYIRVRKPDLDYGRMQRNRQLINRILVELRSPAKSLRVLCALPFLQNEVSTRLGVMNTLRLAWAVGKYGSRPIEWDTLRRDQVLPYKTAQGAQVLVTEAGVMKNAGRTLMGKPRRYAVAPDTQPPLSVFVNP